MRDTVYEVHYWPIEGRILIVHIPNFGLSADIPILTELMVLTANGSINDATFVTAMALADAGKPAAGALAEHADGRVRYVRTADGKYDWKAA